MFPHSLIQEWSGKGILVCCITSLRNWSIELRHDSLHIYIIISQKSNAFPWTFCISVTFTVLLFQACNSFSHSKHCNFVPSYHLSFALQFVSFFLFGTPSRLDQGLVPVCWGIIIISVCCWWSRFAIGTFSKVFKEQLSSKTAFKASWSSDDAF